ncbi:MAG TPA: AIR synthase-related protein, partial [Acidimicrobiia bacterium]|nr:AIR synthase-related protein [Acidimicrobiia bacterium]
SLARKVFFDVAGISPDDPAWKGAHHSVADELLIPSVIYAPAMLELREHVEVKAFAHITGGGIPGNLSRALPDGCDAVVRRGDWEAPRVFREIQALGNVPDEEMERVFNLGIGMVAVVPAAEAHHAIDRLRLSGRQARRIGEVVRGHGRVHVESSS